jgi:hypothetical protein
LRYDAEMKFSQQPRGFIARGTKVRLDGQDKGGPEYGVVVHCWHDTDIDAYDCYVAFFGSSYPTAKPSEKPNVLRYATTSLNVVEE